jgi:hypothetical protein
MRADQPRPSVARSVAASNARRISCARLTKLPRVSPGRRDSAIRVTPVAASIAFEGRAFGRAIYRLRLTNFDPADFRHLEASICNPHTLRHAERLACILRTLEARIASAFLEEVDKCPLEISQGLLKGLRIRLLQPCEVELTLESSELLRKLLPRNTLTGLQL